MVELRSDRDYIRTMMSTANYLWRNCERDDFASSLRQGSLHCQLIRTLYVLRLWPQNIHFILLMTETVHEFLAHKRIDDTPKSLLLFSSAPNTIDQAMQTMRRTKKQRWIVEDTLFSRFCVELDVRTKNFTFFEMDLVCVSRTQCVGSRPCFECECWTFGEQLSQKVTFFQRSVVWKISMM